MSCPSGDLENEEYRKSVVAIRLLQIVVKRKKCILTKWRTLD